MSKAFFKVALPSLAAMALAMPAAVSAGEKQAKQEVPPPTIDTNGDGKPDAWDRDANGVPDAWDTDGDGKPDKLDTDGDGRPDETEPPAKPR